MNVMVITGEAMTVGRLAKAAGVSVRTLHHYDAIGLLTPSGRSEAGYRLYSASDVERLQQIRSLQALGFSLDQIHDVLTGRRHDLVEIIEWHLASIDEELGQLHRLRSRLSDLAATLHRNGTATSNDLLELMKEMTMVEKYYTPEQLETLANRREAYGDEAIRGFERQWEGLIARAKAARASGADPLSEPVLEIAREWSGLVNAFTGGDPGIHQAVQNVWGQETNMHGYDATEMRDLITYLGPAMEKIGQK
jgi:MerR family transcriptional regulator, thiopeptide resistance regulator